MPRRAELWPKWQKTIQPTPKRSITAPGSISEKVCGCAAPLRDQSRALRRVAPEDRAALKNYLKMLQSLAISTYQRAEQKAYWINLYNALTVDIILSRFPVASIRDINISPA